MKTNVVMVRKIGDFDILQRTQDGYFDANVLLTQWNKDNLHNKKRIDKFLTNDKTKEFIDVLENELKTENSHVEKNTYGNYQVVSVKK